VKTTTGGVVTTVRLESKTAMSLSFVLDQNYPNPFNPSTTIRYQIPHASFVCLSVFDILGRKVAEPVSEFQNPGQYAVRWNATSFPSGVYFYQVRTDEFVGTRRLMLLK
jgi:hypothetical protein